LVLLSACRADFGAAEPIRNWGHRFHVGFSSPSRRLDRDGERPSELDGRVRLLTPTPKMMALDREWLVYNYVPLHAIFPDSYSEPIARDPAFQADAEGWADRRDSTA
jgi:hypothetical protein